MSDLDSLKTQLLADIAAAARHLAERDDGTYLDIVFWQSHADALAASGKMMEEMAQSEAMTMIDN